MIIRTANPLAGVASAQLIDVSNFQHAFNWFEAKRQVPNLVGGIFRLTEGLPASHDNSPDPFAAHNRESLHGAGLVQGAYHFLHPSLPGKDQARYFVDEYDRLGLFAGNMLFVDNETTDGLGPAAIAACARAFMDELDVLVPHNPHGVYSNLDYAFNGSDAGLGKYPWWAAHPGGVPTPPQQWSKWTMWQWGTRHTSGEVVDADAYNGTVSDFHRFLASFNPQPTGPVKHITDGKLTLTELAATRQERPGTFLTQQFDLAGADVEDNLGGEVLPAGLPYYTR